MPQREQAGCAHNSSVVAMTWWRKVHRMQLCAYPLESRRVPPAVVVKTHVGVDLDDQQRLGRRVVDQVPGQLPEPRRRDPFRPGMGALGWDEQCAELTTRGQGQRPGATCYAEPSVVVGQAEQQRLRGVERADDPAHDSVGGRSGPDLAPCLHHASRHAATAALRL